MNVHNTSRLIAAAVVLLLPAICPGQPACPISYGTTDDAKPNKLYLYFPSADDNTFPNYGTLVSPAKKFDVTQLTSYTGTATSLINRIRDVVVDDYCEFNVKVITTTSAPPATFPRRVTVAVGTDSNVSPPGCDPSNPTASCYTWGQAQEVDLNDAVAIDFARVWAGTYQAKAGGSGGALNGANSTLDRWAFSIGGTAAHEAGHTFGLSHTDGANMKAGEGAVGTSIMPAGFQISDEERACCRRRFNDATFSLLASNLGLSIQTMHNWDFINPNSSAATKLQVEFLGTQASMLLTWSYSGTLSPWINPTVSGPSGTQVLQGTTYNKFRIEWSSGQAWANGPAGTVPAGVKFHIGATFSGVDYNQPNPILITKVTLFDAGNNPLTLSPRMFGYDSGAADASDGSFKIRFHNLNPAAGSLLLTNLAVRELPVPISMDSMVEGAPLRDWRGVPVLPWSAEQRRVGAARAVPQLPQRIEVKEVSEVTIAHLAQGRHVFDNFKTPDCKPPADRSFKPDVNECVNGTNVDLFPATTVFVTASVIDPNAQHWDPVQGRMVTGPVESKLFYQFGGIHPDLNKNGVDDFLDIQRGTSQDRNHDGVPDEVVSTRIPWWWLLVLLIILILITLFWYYRHRPQHA
jgi:Metallo-peptidase family M12B Reprolysin-like